MTEQLKSCPFCGCACTNDKHDDGIHWIACARCGASGPTNTRYSGEEGEDYFDWNTRAEQPEKAGMVMVPRDAVIAGDCALLARECLLRSEIGIAMAAKDPMTAAEREADMKITRAYRDKLQSALSATAGKGDCGCHTTKPACGVYGISALAALCPSTVKTCSDCDHLRECHIGHASGDSAQSMKDA